MIKAFSRSTHLLLALLFLSGCAGMMKNQMATEKAAEKTNGYKYTKSVSDIEKSINRQLLTSSMLTKSNFGKGGKTDFDKITPLEKQSINLRKLRYNGKIVKISTTARSSKAYNLLAKTKKELRFLGKKITSPNDDSFALYTIKDHGSHRTVDVKAIDKMEVTRSSKGAVSMSVMGIGVNYKDFFDIDKSLKKSYVSEKDQWAVLRAADPDAAKGIYEGLRKEIEGKEIEH